MKKILCLLGCIIVMDNAYSLASLRRCTIPLTIPNVERVPAGMAMPSALQSKPEPAETVQSEILSEEDALNAERFRKEEASRVSEDGYPPAAKRRKIEECDFILNKINDQLNTLSGPNSESFGTIDAIRQGVAQLISATHEIGLLELQSQEQESQHHIQKLETIRRAKGIINSATSETYKHDLHSQFAITTSWEGLQKVKDLKTRHSLVEEAMNRSLRFEACFTDDVRSDYEAVKAWLEATSENAINEYLGLGCRFSAGSAPSLDVAGYVRDPNAQVMDLGFDRTKIEPQLDKNRARNYMQPLLQQLRAGDFLDVRDQLDKVFATHKEADTAVQLLCHRDTCGASHFSYFKNGNYTGGFGIRESNDGCWVVREGFMGNSTGWAGKELFGELQNSLMEQRQRDLSETLNATNQRAAEVFLFLRSPASKLQKTCEREHISFGEKLIFPAQAFDRVVSFVNSLVNNN